MAEADDQRLFFALWPDDATRERLAGLARAIPGAEGRATHPQDLHLTLVFLGAVSADRLGCVTAAADAVRGEPFTLRIDRVGFWPRPRILWCGPHEHPPALPGLVTALQARLKDCGFAPEERAFQAHVTLARKARRTGGAELARPVTWPVSDLVLAGSRPGNPPPRYRVLRRWALTG
ncbi:MAG: RNA 2',3'-cyclic phosphodiesterase [Chromatiales bacterium]